MTEQKKAEIIKKFEEGEKLEAIADEEMFSVGGIRNILRMHYGKRLRLVRKELENGNSIHTSSANT